jgi:hypothetical protein
MGRELPRPPLPCFPVHHLITLRQTHSMVAIYQSA